VKERPILFSASMVRALLAGTKTQTRRVVKIGKCPDTGCQLAPCEIAGERGLDLYRLCPYGAPGGRLWVRETWAPHFIYEGVRPSEIKIDAGSCLFYKADGGIIGGCTESQRAPKWRPAIHMPRAASRITLEITAVRVERLQDISQEDAIAEGVRTMTGPRGNRFEHAFYPDDYGSAWEFPSNAYASLWDRINGARSWDANPWVWVVGFRRAA